MPRLDDTSRMSNTSSFPRTLINPKSWLPNTVVSGSCLRLMLCIEKLDPRQLDLALSCLGLVKFSTRSASASLFSSLMSDCTYICNKINVSEASLQERVASIWEELTSRNDLPSVSTSWFGNSSLPSNREELESMCKKIAETIVKPAQD